MGEFTFKMHRKLLFCLPFPLTTKLAVMPYKASYMINQSKCWLLRGGGGHPHFQNLGSASLTQYNLYYFTSTLEDKLYCIKENTTSF